MAESADSPQKRASAATNNPIAITDTEVLIKGSRGRLRRYDLSAIPYVE